MPDRFVVEERPVRGPATHAVVIGVGRYPHLPGGGSATRVKKPEGMGQLTSPPLSARAFATWLIEKYNYPDKPLADVALVASGGGPASFRNPRTGADVAVEPATMDNIETALTEWRLRGKADDRLLFYFCGHGLAKPPNLTLLAEDFGAKPLNPLDGALDFSVFRQAMAQAVTGEQVYFVDACRNTSASLVRAGQPINGRSIFSGDDPLGPRNARLVAPAFHATLRGSAAYAQENQPSAFTQALIQGLDGAGAVNNGRGWRVTTLRLQEALGFVIDRVLKPKGRTQEPATDDQIRLDLHLPAEEPRAVAVVTCAPPAARRVAVLTYQGRGVAAEGPRSQSGEWLVQLPPGQYTFQPQFASGGWSARPIELYLLPVYMELEFEASR
jgi:caspase domain-containing protein